MIFYSLDTVAISYLLSTTCLFSDTLRQICLFIGVLQKVIKNIRSLQEENINFYLKIPDEGQTITGSGSCQTTRKNFSEVGDRGLLRNQGSVGERQDTVSRFSNFKFSVRKTCRFMTSRIVEETIISLFYLSEYLLCLLWIKQERQQEKKLRFKVRMVRSWVCAPRQQRTSCYESNQGQCLGSSILKRSAYTIIKAREHINMGR